VASQPVSHRLFVRGAGQLRHSLSTRCRLDHRLACLPCALVAFACRAFVEVAHSLRASPFSLPLLLPWSVASPVVCARLLLLLLRAWLCVLLGGGEVACTWLQEPSLEFGSTAAGACGRGAAARSLAWLRRGGLQSRGRLRHAAPPRQALRRRFPPRFIRSCCSQLRQLAQRCELVVAVADHQLTAITCVSATTTRLCRCRCAVRYRSCCRLSRTCSACWLAAAGWAS